MPIRVSTGLRSAMVWYDGLSALMDYGHIRVYSGTQPITADNPPNGQFLGYVSTDGLPPLTNQTQGGLLLSLVGAGTLGMWGNWVLKGVDTGTATWWRFVWNDVDPGAVSDYYPRIDGAVGDGLFLPSNQITPATEIPINGFTLVLPFE